MDIWNCLNSREDSQERRSRFPARQGRPQTAPARVRISTWSSRGNQNCLFDDPQSQRLNATTVTHPSERSSQIAQLSL